MPSRIGRSNRLLAAVALVLALAGLPTAAHHGFGEVDTTTTIHLKGTVKAFFYENPHASIDLDVSDKVWHVLLVSPGRLDRLGVTREMLKPGTSLSLTGFAHKRVVDEMRAEIITVADQTFSMLPPK